MVHQSEIDQADVVEDGERLGQLDSPEAHHWWATPTMEELTNYHLGPSCVSHCLLLLFLYSLNVSSFREECLVNLPCPSTVHVDCLDVMKMARSLIL